MKKQNAFNAKHEKKNLLYNKRNKLIDQMRTSLSKQSNEMQYNEKSNLINEKKKNFIERALEFKKKNE